MNEDVLGRGKASFYEERRELAMALVNHPSSSLPCARSSKYDAFPFAPPRA